MKQSSKQNSNKNSIKNVYDDGNIPEIDLPQDNAKDYVEPLPESERPRRDGPGGN